jgi:hypothetical protein
MTTLDSSGDVGWWGSITIGADGLGLISYLDLANGDLKVAHCSNVACTSATKTTIDSVGQVGWDTSVTIGTDGLGLISYLDQSNGNLKVAHCSNVSCTSATKATLDSAGIVGLYTSVTVGTDGLGLISYYDQTNGDLKITRCANVTCSSSKAFFPTTLDSAGDVGLYTSATIGADGLGLISYTDASNGQIKVLHCWYDGCLTATASQVVGGGTQSSLTIGPDGLPVVAIYNGDLRLAYCGTTDCSGVKRDASLDTAGDVGQYPGVTIGTDGIPLTGYYDATNGNFDVAHCSSSFCQPYFRRR